MAREGIDWSLVEGLPDDGASVVLGTDIVVSRIGMEDATPPALPVPTAVHYAGLQLESVLHAVAEEEVRLPDVMPITTLQTAKEISDWEREQAERAAAASRRGVSLSPEVIEAGLLDRAFEVRADMAEVAGPGADTAPAEAGEPGADVIVIEHPQPEAQTEAEAASRPRATRPMGTVRLRSTAEERAAADAVLRWHSHTVHSGDKQSRLT